jgi:hypothetical protein
MSNALNLSKADAITLNESLKAVPGVKLVYTDFYFFAPGSVPSIGVSVYYNTKEECASNILMNGKHFKAMLHGDGSLVYLTGWKMAKKLRQGKMKSLEVAVKKLTDYAKEA